MKWVENNSKIIKLVGGGIIIGSGGTYILMK
jgi:hypothetical protein